MLKNTSNLGAVLSQKEQQKVKGGDWYSWWKQQACEINPDYCNCDTIELGDHDPIHSPDCIDNI